MNKKFLKRLAVGLAILMITGLLCGCSAEIGSGNTADQLYGNLQGNILNGGNIVEYGSILLYVPDNDPSISGEASCIYQIEEDTETGEGLTLTNVFELPDDYPVFHPDLCIWEDDLYILQKNMSSGSSWMSDTGVIRRISLSTGETEDIVSGKTIIQMQIRNGELYYLQADGSMSVCLRRSELDGSDSQRLMTTTVLAATGDFFFYEDESDKSKDSVIYIAPRNYMTYADDIIVTNLETGTSGEITPDSWKEEIINHWLLDTFWPEEDKVYFTGVDRREVEEIDSPAYDENHDFVLSETEQTIEIVPNGIVPYTQCILDNMLYTLSCEQADDTSVSTNVLRRTNLETMETEVYPTQTLQNFLDDLDSANILYTCRLQVSSQGVFLIVSPYGSINTDRNDSGTSSLFYVNLTELEITRLS